jgi:hypothetical protein
LDLASWQNKLLSDSDSDSDSEDTILKNSMNSNAAVAGQMGCFKVLETENGVYIFIKSCPGMEIEINEVTENEISFNWNPVFSESFETVVELLKLKKVQIEKIEPAVADGLSFYVQLSKPIQTASNTVKVEYFYLDEKKLVTVKSEDEFQQLEWIIASFLYKVEVETFKFKI